jgi:hypothetical protein
LRLGALALVLTLTVSGAQAQGSLQKCVGPDGKIQYQDAPCDANAKTAAQIRRDKSAAEGSIKPATDWAREAKKLEARERDAEWQFRKEQLAYQVRMEKCQNARDDIKRERVWESSISELARRSAAVKIAQLEARVKALECP